jgi:hypothetical protein
MDIRDDLDPNKQGKGLTICNHIKKIITSF